MPERIPVTVAVWLGELYGGKGKLHAVRWDFCEIFNPSRLFLFKIPFLWSNEP